GGMGLAREVRVRTAGARLSVLAEKGVLPPFGVRGGGGGATNRFFVRRGGDAGEPSPLPGKGGSFPLEPGGVGVMESSGGRGCGDALDRDPALIAADLAEGYVTKAAAESVYGVVFADPAGDAIDPDLTAARRAVLGGAKRRVRLSAAPELETARGRAI